MKTLNLLLFIPLSVLIPVPAMAGILSTTGISQIDAPSTTDYPQASTLQVFEESTNIAFSNDDIALDAGSITSGRLVDSYNIYFNPESDSSSWMRASGSITFESEILGFIWSKGNLEGSDATLGASGTPYAQVGYWRELEEHDSDLAGLSDFFVSGGGNTLDLSFNIWQTGYDELRVVTAATPEPLTILGASTALGFGVFFKRKLAKEKNKNSVS
ncbi:MAG: PEP-CTERM sorting domain-containing protein [Hydrococcus sp. Prado102]|jgi:hypothetical protein|nr:PEP-CTERM sorting domain-containing protein [Hydrococcus sp. Prado102]